MNWFFLLVLIRFSVSFNRPNILLLFPDQWRTDYSDKYYINNLDINTPIFESIVSNGIRFTNVINPSPLCAPSRACLASGREYDYTGVPNNSVNYPIHTLNYTLYSLLQNNGYYTMTTGKDDLSKGSGVHINGNYHSKELGFSQWERCNGKHQTVVNYPLINDPYGKYLLKYKNWNLNDLCHHNCCVNTYNFTDNSECPYWCNYRYNYLYQDNYITNKTLELLRNKPSNKSWFLQVNFAGPHPPFILTQDMNLTMYNRTYPYPYNCSIPSYDMNIIKQDYVAEIENLDKLFGVIIDYIKHNLSDEYNNTIICISSDHGELLGDYDLFGKDQPWYGSTNVPLTCKGPNIVSDKRINTYVTTLDLMATFLNITDTSVNYNSYNITSESLALFLNGKWNDNNNNYRDYISSGLSHWRLVIKEYDNIYYKYVCCLYNSDSGKNLCGARYPFITNNTYMELLFDITNDPYELKNIGNDNEYSSIMEEMNEYMPANFCDIY